MNIQTLQRKLHTLLHTPRIFWIKLAGSPLFRLFPDRLALKIRYHNVFGRPLNLRRPQTFNEKLQWLKLYDRRPEYTTLVDKYAAKAHVAAIIGDEHIIPTLGVWDSFGAIDFDQLPDQFVLKTTHSSGDAVICPDKAFFDRKDARSRLTKALRKDYYKVDREWPYRDVPRRILAEAYLTDPASPGGLIDYKLMCFNGKVQCTFVCENRFSDQEMTVTVYDNKWRRLPIRRERPISARDITRPAHYEEMRAMAEKLSVTLPFARIDFYEVGGHVWWGEITLYPAGGMEHFYPDEWDEALGRFLKLPIDEKA